MSTYGPKNPQIINAPGWANPDNAKVSDGSFATKLVPAGVKESLASSKFQLGTNPPQLTAITARVTAHADGPGVKVEEAQLIFNGSPIGPNNGDFRELTTSPEMLTYTFTVNLPGPRMAAEDAFGIRFGFKANLGTQTMSLDGITLEAVN